MQQQKNISTDYHYLLLRDQKRQIVKHTLEIQTIITSEITKQQLLQWKNMNPTSKHQIILKVIAKIKQTQWGQSTIARIKQKFVGTAKQLYQFQSKVNYFLVECFRESLHPPTTTSHSEECVNFIPLYKTKINKEVRRTLWQKVLVDEQNKQTFFKFDHQICPFNLNNELVINLLRNCQANGITLKQNQKDNALRLLQFIVKKHNKIPNRSEQCICLCVVDVYSHLTPSKIHQLGAVYVGLLELANSYYEPNLETRIEELMRVFQIVDKDTFSLIQQNYLSQQRQMAEVNQCFEHFRLSLGSLYFPLSACEFMIDQMLIKKFNKLDMYVFFVIMLMIMSDELEDKKGERKLLTEVVYSEKTKAIIKADDVFDAFKVIYEKIPAFPSSGGMERNQLLEQMNKYEENMRDEKQVTMSDEEINEFLIMDNRPQKLSNFMNG